MNTDDDIEETTRPAKTLLDEVSWYLLVMGFIVILLSGVCFFMFRNKPLTYADFSIDANVMGKYLLMIGLLFYVVGRGIHYYRKFQKAKEAP